MSFILNALPESFNLFKTSWNLFNSDQKELNKLISCLLVEGANMKAPEERALLARKNFQGSKFQRKPNHGQQKAAERPTNDSTQKNQFNEANKKDRENESHHRSAKPRNNICNYRNKHGHWAKDCNTLKTKTNSGNESKRHMALMAIKKNQVLRPTTWIADSECSIHITPHLEWILDYRR